MSSKHQLFLLLGLSLAAIFQTVATAQEAPSAEAPSAAAKATPTIEADVVYGHKMGMALTLDVIRPEKQNGAAVIFVVSGGWNSNWFPPETYRRVEMLNELVNRGYVVILLRHGSAPLFKVPDAVADVKKAIKFLHDKCGDFGFEANRMGVCGMSAGGHLSLMLGTDTNSTKSPDKSEEAASPKNSAKVAAVVAYFPPTDLRSMVGPSRDFPALDFDKAKGEDVSPLVCVTPDDAPTLLIHGTKDRLVPLRHSEEIKAAFDEDKVPCELITIEGAGHGFRGDDSKRATQASIEWFDRFLNEQGNK
ncbi:MAG: alpha/beta hydrolase [Pirellulaceae bacterium]